jgi:hypothetical protein
VKVVVRRLFSEKGYRYPRIAQQLLCSESVSNKVAISDISDIYIHSYQRIKTTKPLQILVHKPAKMYNCVSPRSTSYLTASPMDIPTSSRSTTCAYPSWPRRSSLSSTSSDSESYHNHSFIISDEELFASDDVFEDSPASTPASDLSRSPAMNSLSTPYVAEARSYMEEARYVVESGSLMREVVREEKARRKRSVSVNSKKSRRGSKKMGTIKEVVE